MLFRLQNLNYSYLYGTFLLNFYLMKKNYIQAFILLIAISFSSYSQVIDDDFEDGDLSGWTEGTASDWTNSTSSPITGTRSLKHNLSGVTDESYIYHDISSLDLSTQNISWQFNLANGSWDPSGSNRFWYIYGK